MKSILLALSLLAAISIPAIAQKPAPVNETGHGTQIGQHPYEGFSGWGAYPVIQQTAGTDPYTALVLFGLIAPGTAPLKVAGVTILSGTQSPIASGLTSTIPSVFYLTTGTNAAAPFSEYVLTSGSTGWRPVTTGTGP